MRSPGRAEAGGRGYFVDRHQAFSYTRMWHNPGDDIPCTEVYANGASRPSPSLCHPCREDSGLSSAEAGRVSVASPAPWPLRRALRGPGLAAPAPAHRQLAPCHAAAPRPALPAARPVARDAAGRALAVGARAAPRGQPRSGPGVGLHVPHAADLGQGPPGRCLSARCRARTAPLLLPPDGAAARTRRSPRRPAAPRGHGPPGRVSRRD
jgi:hypothetical protein